MTSKRETTGAPTTIRLSADRNEIAADGEDIALVRVEILDSAGRPLPTANNLVKFRVSGEGVLLGVGNGEDPHASNRFVRGFNLTRYAGHWPDMLLEAAGVTGCPRQGWPLTATP